MRTIWPLAKLSGRHVCDSSLQLTAPRAAILHTDTRHTNAFTQTVRFIPNNNLLSWQGHYMLGLALVNGQRLSEGIKALEKVSPPSLLP